MFRPSVGQRQVVYTEEDIQYNMQVFRYWDVIQFNIICVQIETVLSLIRANWMLWLVGWWVLGLCAIHTHEAITQPPRGPTYTQHPPTNHNIQFARIKLNTVSICTQIMLSCMTSQYLNTCILYWISSSVYTTWRWPTEGRNMLFVIAFLPTLFN